MDAAEILKQFGDSVRQHRRKLGWSQERLADEAGLDRTYVSGVERGVRNPTVLTVAALADALGVEITSLFQLELKLEPLQTDAGPTPPVVC